MSFEPKKDSFEDMMAHLVAQNLTYHDTVTGLLKAFPDMTASAVESRLTRYKKRLKKQGGREISLDHPITKSIEYKEGGITTFDRIIALANGEDLTPERVMVAHGLDPCMWEVVSCKSNFYQTQRKGGQILNLYQSKLIVKPIADGLSFDMIRKEFDSLQAKYTPQKPLPVRKDESGEYLYEINIADLHLGRFASRNETGERLDIETTKERFFNVINAEVDRICALGDKVQKVLFVWSNDFFNSDGIGNSTTKGTPQDTGVKWQELFNTGVEMLVRAIDTIATYAPVKTFYVASNHSRQTDYYAICFLSAWFRSYPNVEIDTSYRTRHYEVFGSVLLGFSHSCYEQKKNLPYLMSVEQPEAWGRTNYREFHLAHDHTEKVEEKGGIIFRWLPTITSPDTWTTDCGYSGNVKRSYSFLYHRDRGLVCMNCTKIDN